LTTLDFDREYLRNGLRYTKSEKQVINYSEKNLVNFGPLTKKLCAHLDSLVLACILFYERVAAVCVRLGAVPQPSSSQRLLGDGRQQRASAVLDERRRCRQHDVSRQRSLQDLLHGRRHQATSSTGDLDQRPLRQPRLNQPKLVLLRRLQVVPRLASAKSF